MRKPTSSSAQYRFEDFVLDIGRGILLRGQDEMPLRRQSFEVLVYLIENRGRLVTREELLDAVWAGRMVTDASITQCLVDIRAALEDAEHQKIRTLTRRGYRFELPVVREVDDAASRDSASAPPARGSGPAPAGRRVWIGLVVLALVAAASWWLGRVGDEARQDDRTDNAPLIAALPLKNLSPETQTNEFVIGFHDVLLAELARQQGIAVIGRWTLESLGPDADDVASLREGLGVDFALVGSVSRDASMVRFNFQLHETASGLQRWANTYVEPLSATQLLHLQHKVAQRVAAEASGRAAGANSEGTAAAGSPAVPPTASLVAYERYLDGTYYLRRSETGESSLETLQAARHAFEAAMAADPLWPPPYAAFARVLQFHATNRIVPDAWQESRRLLDRALELDPDYGPALATLGYYQWRFDRDPVAAEGSLSRARDLGEPVHWELAILYTALGRMEESLARFRRAAATDPLNIVIRAHYARSLLCDERWERAIEVIAPVVEYDNHPIENLQLAYAELKSGRVEQGLARWTAHRGSYPQMDGFFHLAVGEIDSARAELERLAAIDPVPPVDAIELAVRLGDLDRAFAWLESRVESHPDSLRLILCEAKMRELEGTPRFDRILRELGLR
jgi:DNA-binding winged helix-turn-helix (wHTH) protein/TolB-like protein